VIYVDSSVALAHLLVESRSPPASLWNEPLVSSQLLEYEVWNRIHAYGLGRSHANEAQALLIRVALIEMTAAVLARALEPFPTPVRTLDALHLSTIEYVSNRRQTVELASYDNRLCAAAQALGISIAAL
jgi:predicted nucleic acid-binding protein